MNNNQILSLIKQYEDETAIPEKTNAVLNTVGSGAKQLGQNSVKELWDMMGPGSSQDLYKQALYTTPPSGGMNKLNYFADLAHNLFETGISALPLGRAALSAPEKTTNFVMRIIRALLQKKAVEERLLHGAEGYASRFAREKGPDLIREFNRDISKKDESE